MRHLILLTSFVAFTSSAFAEPLDALHLPPGYAFAPIAPRLALSRSARRKKIAGAALIGVGTLFLVVGTLFSALATGQALDSDCPDGGRPADCWVHDYPAGAYLGAAIGFGIVGLALLPAGIATYVSGGHDHDALQNLYFVPTTTPTTSGATLKVTF